MRNDKLKGNIFITILLSFRIYVRNQINRSTSKKDDFVNVFNFDDFVIVNIIVHELYQA